MKLVKPVYELSASGKPEVFRAGKSKICRVIVTRKKSLKNREGAFLADLNEKIDNIKKEKYDNIELGYKKLLAKYKAK